MSPRRRRALLALGAGVLVAAVLLFVLALGTRDVIERGHLLPQNPDLEVDRIRLFGAITAFGSNRLELWNELLNGLALAGMSGVALVAALIVGRLGGAGHRRLVWFYALLFAGTALLAVDESLELSETLEYNIQHLVTTLGPSSEVSDVDVFVYTVPALAFVALFRRELLSARRALPWLSAGVGVYLVATFLDFVEVDFHRESLEVLSSALLVLGFAALAAENVNGLVASTKEAGAQPREHGAAPSGETALSPTLGRSGTSRG